MPKKHNGAAGQNASVTVVLKVQMHCGGCASKIVKFVKGLEGVEGVKSEWEVDNLTFSGKVDPVKVRDNLAEKTKKKVDLVSPVPKKENNKKPEEKKPNLKEKEPPATTAAVLKLSLHCQGCIDKINKILSKTAGIQEKSIDKQKDLVTVKGTMDAKALVESLKKNLKRPVEIVPPKKEKEGGGDGGKKENGGGATKMEGNKMEYTATPGFGFGYAPVDGPYPNPYFHDGYYGNAYPQMFSEENPNACSVM